MRPKELEVADIFRRHGGAFRATQGNRPRTDHARPGYPRPAPHRRRLRRQAIGAHLAVQASTIVDRHINHGAPRILLVVIGRRSASASASPSRGPGNGILRAETGGLFQAQDAGEQSEFGSQTTLRLTNPPELGGFCLPGNRPGLSGRRGCNHISFATGANPSARVRSRRRNVAQSVGSVCGSKSMRLRPCLRSDFR